MQVPAPNEALRLLAEAEQRHPGKWVQHALTAGDAAQRIARLHPELDPDIAFALGCLHDIGRRAGKGKLRHIIEGHRYLESLGHANAARVCLTHSFPVAKLGVYRGARDVPPADLAFLEEFLATVEFDPYDRLIQFCDAVCLPGGCCLIETRQLRLALRDGVDALSVEKWQALYAIRDDLEKAVGTNLYGLLPGVVENSLGLPGQAPPALAPSRAPGRTFGI